ncbi:MAG: 30S ribosomal protein S8e [Candidatus Aenigmatarchaeota archaeon]
MMRAQTKSNKKPTGGAYHKMRKKKVYELAGDFFPVKLAENSRKISRTQGGNRKVRVLQANKAIVFPGGKLAKIITVKENAANPNFVRMNIITKGAVIETDLGMARVTSRPGQHGLINAKLIEKK